MFFKTLHSILCLHYSLTVVQILVQAKYSFKAASQHWWALAFLKVWVLKPCHQSFPWDIITFAGLITKTPRGWWDRTIRALLPTKPLPSLFPLSFFPFFYLFSSGNWRCTGMIFVSCCPPALSLSLFFPVIPLRPIFECAVH